jgi:hypothetical protein
MASSPLRFVVLHHTGYGEPHFDLMFERNGALMTWRSPRWPVEVGANLQRIADHRLAYLEFEGALSDNRGLVRRVDSGEFVMCEDAGRISIVVNESTGFVLKRTPDDLWVVDAILDDD